MSTSFDADWITRFSLHVDGLEHNLAYYNNMKCAAALILGSAASCLALIIFGVEIGDDFPTTQLW